MELNACCDQARPSADTLAWANPALSAMVTRAIVPRLDVEYAEVVRGLPPCDREVRHQQMPVVWQPLLTAVGPAGESFIPSREMRHLTLTSRADLDHEQVDRTKQRPLGIGEPAAVARPRRA